MAKEKFEELTFKVTPTGDGSLYTYRAYNAEGEEVVEESSTQAWPSAADAEKVMRTMVDKRHTLEVDGINNINKDSNDNVNLVVPKDSEKDQYAGMTPVDESIDDVIEEKKEEDLSKNKKAQKELKDQEKAKAKADAERAKDLSQ